VVTDGGMRMSVVVDVGEIDSAITGDGDRWIKDAWRLTSAKSVTLNLAHRPSGPGIVGNNHRLDTVTTVIRKVDGPIGGYFDVAMNATAAIRHRIINGGGSAEI